MNKKIVLMTICVGLLFVTSCFAGISAALSEADANTYAPILYFEKNEKCYPVDVSYALSNSYLYVVGTPDPISTSPTAEMLANGTLGTLYLDNQLGTVDDSGIEIDYQSKMAVLGYTVYAHVDTVSNSIQYWFFYAFNGGDINRHEGDWEMVQVMFSGDQPSSVMYSQHYSGQSALWKQVEKEGEHVKVYVARGSHANYIKPYSGKLGLASDTVGDNGKVLQPTEYTVEVLNNQPWLSFAGRWGWFGANQSQATEAALLGKAGPNGPMFREDGSMWQPLTFAAGLQAANDGLFVLEWFVYNFVMLFIVFSLLTLVLLCFFIYRRHKKYGLGPRKISILYIDGLNLKSIGNILCIVAIVVAVLGIVYPWYSVTANVAIPGYQQTGTFNALAIDGMNGVQIQLPGAGGPVPMGTVALPFYVLIAIGLVFMFLATIGVSQSQKLGRTYIFRGIRLFIPVLLIIIVVMAIGSIIPLLAPADVKGNVDMIDAAKAISSSPSGGQYTITISEGQAVGAVHLQWGFGIGLYLLLLAAFIFLIAGFIEMAAKTQFFETKEPMLSRKERRKMKNTQPKEEQKKTK